MKKLLNIFLVFLLTLAVTDYIWIELLSDDQIAVEFESEKEKESEEELREYEVEESKHESLESDLPHLGGDNQLINLHSGFVKIGNSFKQTGENTKPSLVIRYHQLKIPC